MSVSEKIIRQGLKQAIASIPVNTCYMVDDQGKEVQITTAMIRSTCHQLLKKCRTIKN